MQWVKSVFAAAFALGLGWCGWLAYTGEFARLAVALAFLLLFAGIFIFAIRPLAQSSDLARALRKNGVALNATILEVNGTSKYVNKLPILKVKVKFFHGQKEITGEIEQAIPFERLAAIRPSRQISILADPAHDGRFVLDL